MSPVIVIIEISRWSGRHWSLGGDRVSRLSCTHTKTHQNFRNKFPFLSTTWTLFWTFCLHLSSQISLGNKDIVCFLTRIKGNKGHLEPKGITCFSAFTKQTLTPLLTLHRKASNEEKDRHLNILKTQPGSKEVHHGQEKEVCRDFLPRSHQLCRY